MKRFPGLGLHGGKDIHTEDQNSAGLESSQARPVVRLQHRADFPRRKSFLLTRFCEQQGQHANADPQTNRTPPWPKRTTRQPIPIFTKHVLPSAEPVPIFAYENEPKQKPGAKESSCQLPHNEHRWLLQFTFYVRLTMSTGNGDRFTYMTPDDHQRWLWFTHIYCPSIVILVGFLRLRRKFRCLGLDDALLLAAHVRPIACIFAVENRKLTLYFPCSFSMLRTGSWPSMHYLASWASLRTWRAHWNGQRPQWYFPHPNPIAK